MVSRIPTFYVARVLLRAGAGFLSSMAALGTCDSNVTVSTVESFFDFSSFFACNRFWYGLVSFYGQSGYTRETVPRAGAGGSRLDCQVP